MKKPPTIGPATGPMKVAPEKRPSAKSLSTGPQKSANVPPMIVNGEHPNSPAKNRDTMIFSMFWATATGS